MRSPSTLVLPAVLNPTRRRSLSSIQSDQSVLIGPREPPLLEHTLPFHWSNHLLPNYHHHLALISKLEPASPFHQENRRNDCLRLSYAQLDQSINSIAFSLLQLGIRKGDRVGINTPNHSIYPILQWATSKIGAILATINPSYAPSELLNAIKKVDCKVLFSTPSFKSKDMLPMLSDLIDRSSSLKNLVIVDNESYQVGKRSKEEIFKKINHHSSVIDLDEFLNHHHSITSPTLEKIHNQLHAEDIINLQFTSGTTGLPKAVSLTHRNLLNNSLHIADRINLTGTDLLCNVPPMFHCFGAVVGNLAAQVKGAAIVIPGESFDPKAVLKTVSEERCTVLNGVGTMFLAEISALDEIKDKLDLSSLRTGVVAGSPVPEELMNRIEHRLGIKELTILYGMTETSPGTFQTQPSDDPIKRKTTVGKIYPHTMAKVVDLQTGQVVERGQKGELMISGYSVQKGYWEDVIETQKALVKDSQGRIWMKTGDISIIDQQGYLKIVGRAKEVIIRGGENLYPAVIEDTISKLTGVKDVAVVGVEDEFYGEVVGVFIKRRMNNLTESQVKQVIKDKMSGANVPKYIWFLDLIGQEEFPMTASGKIKKNQLKIWVKDLINEEKINKKI